MSRSRCDGRWVDAALRKSWPQTFAGHKRGNGAGIKFNDGQCSSSAIQATEQSTIPSIRVSRHRSILNYKWMNEVLWHCPVGAETRTWTWLVAKAAGLMDREWIPFPFPFPIPNPNPFSPTLSLSYEHRAKDNDAVRFSFWSQRQRQRHGQ